MGALLLLAFGPALVAGALGAALPGGWPALAAGGAGILVVWMAMQAPGLALLLPLGYGAACAGMATWLARLVRADAPRPIAALASAATGGALGLLILAAALPGA